MLRALYYVTTLPCRVAAYTIKAALWCGMLVLVVHVYFNVGELWAWTATARALVRSF